MGYYINPDGITKETWLAEYGKPLTLVEVKDFDFDSDELPVCLVDNGAFTAAGIAYDVGERDAFLYPDRRPRSWFAVKRDLLKEWYEDSSKALLP